MSSDSSRGKKLLTHKDFCIKLAWNLIKHGFSLLDQAVQRLVDREQNPKRKRDCSECKYSANIYQSHHNYYFIL